LTVLDKVTIAYRGATYEIGRGRDYFGIWTVDGPRSQPLEWWPGTQEGWSAAWTRFAVLEAPEAIAPAAGETARSGERAGLGSAPATAARRGALMAALLLALGVALGVAGLFPDYLTGTSLASQPENLVAHVIYLAGWTAGGVLIALGGSRVRIGALLATGLSIVTFGLFFSDVGTPISGGAHLAGAGLVLSLLGWLACAAGSATAFVIGSGRAAIPAAAAHATDPALTAPVVPATDPAPTAPVVSASDPVLAAGPAVATYSLYAPGPGFAAATPARPSRRLVTLGRPRGAALGPAILLILAGLGAAAAFAPAWDSFTLHAASGQTQTITEGNAFSNPGPVIAGNVVVMLALAAVVIIAALWRPVRLGAVLLAGAIIPMAAQVISALIQVGEPNSPTQFGFTPTEANQLGLTISSGLTPAFWIYCVFIVVLVVSCVWMLFIPQEAPVPAIVGAGPAFGPDADTQVPTWHVARAETYNVPGARVGTLDDRDRDADEETSSDEFNSYEEFDSDNPADGTMGLESRRDEGGAPGHAG
jgi:hypothetical protein